ncbi:unnamed protein product [Paramecium sonneborni]|uniref:Casein kinase II subunit beta n=1 Tax=Paramecium sonneborni TaxID=65129 RepID=A0A8S1LHM7_9CILI|nr:unnamed protein product [Paramecium sonneborni]
MSEESQYSEHPGGWVEWFCQLPQNQYLTEVDSEFIQDPNNYGHLIKQFNLFQQALQMILSSEQPDTLDLENEKFLELYTEASDIYGLLHQAFIQTPKGLAIMRERFLNGRFGHCPRVLCEKQNTIPIGLSESLKTSRIKVYCPRCKEAYAPRKSQADFDGAYFGRSFPMLLLLTYPDIHPKYTIQLGTELFTPFQPTLFGFKVRDESQIQQTSPQLQQSQLQSQQQQQIITEQTNGIIEKENHHQQEKQNAEQESKQSKKKKKNKNK